MSGAKNNLLVLRIPSLLCHSERTHLCGSEESHCATGYKPIFNQFSHSERLQGVEESHCVTGCKFILHRHEKILHFVQNDDIII
ncbi:MAG: hypothetical protein N4A43_03050 [Alphaproteobacteria bacterium]|nr:hypothetical protein [Alphaproteobacteria bacterium]